MKKTILFLLIFFHFTPIFSQENIRIGTKQHLFSKSLNEERSFWIYLPDDYENSQYPTARYPVMYLLDPEINFHSFTGIVQNLASGPYARIPQMIVIGICNTNRTRDLTPSEANNQAFFGKHRAKPQETGGNQAFITFIEKELRPYIDSHFRTSGYNLINGHSFGGLTAVNILLNHPHLFNAYIIIDPSLWWDNELLIKQADSIFDKKDFNKRNIYLAMANKKAIAQDTTTDMARGIKKFHQLIEKKNPKNLRWAFHFYEKEDHGTISIPAEYDGLQFLFEHHLIQVKEAIQNPNLIEEQFQKLSSQTGFNFFPSQSYLNWMSNYCIDINKPQLRIPFTRLIQKYYPDSSKN